MQIWSVIGQELRNGKVHLYIGMEKINNQIRTPTLNKATFQMIKKSKCVNGNFKLATNCRAFDRKTS